MDEIPDVDLYAQALARAADVDKELLAIAQGIALIYGDDDFDAPPETREAWAAYRRLKDLTIVSIPHLMALLQRKKVANDG